MLTFNKSLSVVTILCAIIILSACQIVIPDGVNLETESIAEVTVKSVPTECTLETIKGTYIFEGQGSLILDEETTVPYSEAGIWSLDGKGNAEGVFSANVGPDRILEEFVGTYTQNPGYSGCAFTVIAPISDQEFTQFEFYASPSGDMMTYFGPGFSGTHTRVDHSLDVDCSLETIEGTYIFEGEGSFILDKETILPYSEAGVWTLDGNGAAEGIFSANVGPDRILEEFVGTYTQDAGCAFTVIAPISDQEFTQFEFYASPSGDMMTYFGPGFSGTHTRQ